LVEETINPFVIFLDFYMLFPDFKWVLRSAASKNSIKNILVPASRTTVDLALHRFALVFHKALNYNLPRGRFHVVFKILKVLFITVLHVQLFLLSS